VTPKRTLLISSGILGFLGVLVSVVIIAIGGGFSGPGPSILSPPSARDLWSVGNNLTNGTRLNYSLTSGYEDHLLTNLSISMKFIDEGKEWKVLIHLGKIRNPSIYNVSLSKVSFTPVGVLNQSSERILRPVSSTIFSIRDIAREPKYLVVGAIWDTISIGTLTVPLRITKLEEVNTPAGSFQSYVLGYPIGTKDSRIYLVKGFPLPIKSEVYGANGTLEYRYELTSIGR
jgi:hypothetical protein